MIGIINYGLGNINSIKNVLTHIGVECKILNNINETDGISKYILPGVGSFDAGMQGLKSGNWIDFLRINIIERKIPILGICLGMQLMCLKSEEGLESGLGFVNAEVKKFNFNVSSQMKIPHMGWNTVKIQQQNPLVPISEDEKRFYFVHSYHVVCNNYEDIILTADYGVEVTSMFMKQNIYGVQFHPEKSHKFGISLLSNFSKL